MAETKKRAALVTMDLVDPELKKAWLDWCASQGGVSSSQAFRTIVRRLTAKSSKVSEDEVKPGVEYEASEKPTFRREVRLSASEFEKASALAANEGFSLNRWMHALVRARITGSPQFGQSEIEALTESNLRLLTIGRNLNQVARVLNGNKLDVSAYRIDLIERLNTEVRDHTKKVSDLMTANVFRWRIK